MRRQCQDSRFPQLLYCGDEYPSETGRCSYHRLLQQKSSVFKETGKDGLVSKSRSNTNILRIHGEEEFHIKNR